MLPLRNDEQGDFTETSSNLLFVPVLSLLVMSTAIKTEGAFWYSLAFSHFCAMFVSRKHAAVRNCALKSVKW